MSRAQQRRHVLALEGAPGPRDEAAGPGATERSWTALALVGLSVLGLGLAAYLTSVHYAPGILVCSSTGVVDCAKVLSSAYSVVPGTNLPITVPGMAFFLLSLGLALAQLRRPGSVGLRQAHLAWAGFGMLTVFYLIYVELVELRTICLWCSSVHLVIFATLLLTLWRLHPAEPDRV